DLVDENAVIRLEHEVSVGPADIDAYARHGSPDLPRAAVPDPRAQRLLLSTDRRGNIVSIDAPARPPSLRREASRGVMRGPSKRRTSGIDWQSRAQQRKSG